MIRQTLVSAFVVLALSSLSLGCQSGGVGDPCIPNDEFSKTYAGATETGAQIEDRSFQCETRVCLVKHFRGRVTCPFGNKAGRDGATIANYDGTDGDRCLVPGTNIEVSAAVRPQCRDRKDEVYCSCRCEGTDANAKYCECPDGFVCSEVTKSLDESLVRPGDKYCIKKGDTFTDGNTCQDDTCDIASDHCGYSSNSQQL